MSIVVILNSKVKTVIDIGGIRVLVVMNYCVIIHDDEFNINNMLQ